MKFLRSKILIVIASVFLLTGYAHAVMDKCCEEEQTQQADHGKSVPKDDQCQCLCHKIFSNVSPTPVRLPVLIPVLQAVRRPAAEFPPDTEPQGIDYPPQLA